MSILLLVGAALFACGEGFASSAADVKYTDVTNVLVGTGVVLHDDATSSDLDVVSGGAPSVGAAAAIAIGSSTGLVSAPAGSAGGAWDGAAIPTNTLTLTGVAVSDSTAEPVTLDVGGPDNNLAAFNGTSKNFALAIGNVKELFQNSFNIY